MTRASAPVALGALVLSTTLLLTGLLAGCSGDLDRAHRVQTGLGRLDQVARAEVTTPTGDRAAAITISYTTIPTGRELGRLLAEVDEAADEADYPSYRLDLQPADSPGDTLVVDDTFIGSAAEPAVLTAWAATSAALLGEVTYSYEPSHESISVDAGPGIAHDVGEASRVGYGRPGTTWTFLTGDSAFVVSGRVLPTDVALFSAVQRSVSSAALPVTADRWRLERRSDHLRLDLDVDLAATITPQALTLAEHGADVGRLVDAALAALRRERRPVWLRLHHRAAADDTSTATDDVFGSWVSGQRPVPGRDRLRRGWDQWLAQRAAPGR